PVHRGRRARRGRRLSGHAAGDGGGRRQRAGPGDLIPVARRSPAAAGQPITGCRRAGRQAATGPGGSTARPLGHNAVVLLTELVLTSQAVAATPRRSVKIEEIARLPRASSPEEVPVVVAFLSGELLQRQIGVGYAALGGLLTGDGAADETVPALTVS